MVVLAIKNEGGNVAFFGNVDTRGDLLAFPPGFLLPHRPLHVGISKKQKERERDAGKTKGPFAAIVFSLL